MEKQQENKTKELFIYIADRLKDEPSYGATLLNKAFYFIDNLNYLHNKKPISGFKYVKQERGPTPKPSEFLPLRNELLENQEIEETRSEFFGRLQIKYVAKRQPNIELFDKQEITLIDQVLLELSRYNASGISNFSHTFLAWQIAENMDELPLYSFLLTSKQPTDEQIAWAKGKIEKYKSNRS